MLAGHRALRSVLSSEYRAGITSQVAPRMTSFAMGFIDRSGSARTPSRFFDAQPFKSGVSAVRLMGDFRYAFINSRGDLIVEPRFHHVFAEAGGRRRVNVGGRREDGVVRGGRWGYVDPTGVCIEPMFEYA